MVRIDERKRKARRRVSVCLVIVATLAVLTVGVTGQSSAIRTAACVIALAAGTGGVVLAERRGQVASWLVIAAVVALVRVVAEL